MHSGGGKFVYIILIILFLIDLYAFRGLRHFLSPLPISVRTIVSVVYWLVPLFILIMTIIIGQNIGVLVSGKMYYRVFYTFMGVLVLFYVPKIIFSAFELGNDLVNLVIFTIRKLHLGGDILRFQSIRYVGAFLAILLFVFTFYGIIHGRYHYKVNRMVLNYRNLPENFDGFKIVHISDWHIGSYYNKPEKIMGAVGRINALNPDLILFTGDLVNNVATEVEEFLPALKQLHAKYGVYSVLGNHDYGEYVNWPSEEEKESNIKKLIDLQASAGFRLLLNESEEIEIDGQKISIIGVENWGLPPFPQYGNLSKALGDNVGNNFQVLMSHDPSHWDAEVKGKTNIGLTLSGHTHGMQFGFILRNLKWSPVKLKYPRWAGLYSNDSQKLYVNVGIGYIGFPGRVGIRPEIAVLELKRQL
ncbi:MAG: metallophosphoesterase [Bacteroidales bacterium]|nr:metallophosphoesterase [Bacteroidales bacterium]